MSSKSQYKDALKRSNQFIRELKNEVKRLQNEVKELQRKLNNANIELRTCKKVLKPKKMWWQFWK